MKTYNGYITKLEPHQVFVFGSNLQGFHGAGAAGFATFGINGNVWRNFGYDRWPTGRRGLWNVKGVVEGLQEGEVGKSYAIPTIIRPGARCSIPLSKIKKSISKFYTLAQTKSEWEFLVAYTAKKSLNGYTVQEMASVFAQDPIPENVIFEKEFADIIEESSFTSPLFDL